IHLERSDALAADAQRRREDRAEALPAPGLRDLQVRAQRDVFEVTRAVAVEHERRERLFVRPGVALRAVVAEAVVADDMNRIAARLEDRAGGARAADQFAERLADAVHRLAA